MKALELFRSIGSLLDEGKPFALAKVTGAAGVPGVHTGDTWIVLPGGGIRGKTVMEEMKEFLSGEGRRVISCREAATGTFTVEGGSIDFYFDPLTFPESLIVVGAGHIALPLTDMAARAGFRVTVIDDRDDFAVPARFPRAHKVVAAPFVEALAEIDYSPSTFMILITRGHAWDRECLEFVIAKETGYIGMIGSRRRAGAVLGALKAEGVPRDLLDRVHTPIGLDIGAATPAEIAVSILAELVAVRRCGSSPHSLSRLKGRTKNGREGKEK
jgi:xanthine dehydrogenase accessory factor